MIFTHHFEVIGGVMGAEHPSYACYLQNGLWLLSSQLRERRHLILKTTRLRGTLDNEQANPDEKKGKSGNSKRAVNDLVGLSEMPKS